VNKHKITSVKLVTEDVDWLKQQAEMAGVSISEILRRCVETARTGNLLPRPIILKSQSGESFSKDVKELAKTAWNCKRQVNVLKAAALKQSDSNLRVACYNLLNSLGPLCFDLARLSELAGCVDEETLVHVRALYIAAQSESQIGETEYKRVHSGKVVEAIIKFFGENKGMYVDGE
jgi:hypothetical protein